MQNIFDIEETTNIPRDVSYVISYQSLIKFFENKKSPLSACDLVCGAHMVYGWMPTILELNPTDDFDLQDAANLVNSAKISSSLKAQELESLARLINNSVVGASKLLHFVSPEKFAIWDSKIYSFIYEERPHNYRVNNPQKYFDYIKLLKELTQSPRFPSFHSSVKRKLGYDVTPFRALELVMFLRAPSYRAQ